MAEVSLELKEIKKSFTEGEAVLDNISLEISKGEFITLLGSSGCGKTTTLRIIAGLEQPDAGSVWLDGREVTGLEPNQRDVNTVFQNYALFPHMNVFDNVAFALKLKKVPKKEIEERVKEALKMVQLDGYQKRSIQKLSGGQRQRIMLAVAAMLNKPLIIIDEPTSALDAGSTGKVLSFFRRQAERGTAVLAVSHDKDFASGCHYLIEL